MKPLNLDNRPCSPISSNCVIWQGPDIPCIKLCAGDTISDVIAKLATELCTIMDTLDIKNYDLSCFNLAACPPADFQELIQFLIEQICASQGLDTTKVGTVSTCPDCVVSVASCFVVGRQTTMQLVDYVNMIGQRICDLVSQISDLQSQINNLEIRVTVLENTPVPDTIIPSFTLSCAIGSLSSGTSQFINVTLQEFINNVWCPFYAATGSTSDLLSAVDAICITDADLQLTTGTPFSDNSNWIESSAYSTVADAINNLWIALCDVYNAADGFNPTGGSTSSTTVDITAGVVTALVNDTDWVNLNGFSWYGPYNTAANRIPQCRRIGNVIHFRGVIMIPLEDPTNSLQPLVWDYKGSSPLTDTYFTNTTVTPSQVGPGSVVLDNGGSMQFNQGLSVIPITIVDNAVQFDNNYSLGFKLAIRPVRISVSPLFSGALNSLLNVIITSDKKLVIQLIKDFEESAGTGGTPGNPYSSSIANNVISHVRTGEFVPQYQSATSVMASSPVSGVQNVELDYDSTLTYGFDCDANDETNLGGFGWIALDGLMAYLDPCTTDIKVSTPC